MLRARQSAALPPVLLSNVRRLAGLALVACLAQPAFAQVRPPGPPGPTPPAAPAPQTAHRALTLPDAVAIFLAENLDLVAARYDIDTVDAEKLTAGLRPNPDISVESTDLPVDFSGPVLQQQTLSYGISQTIELGGKRKKRVAAANAQSELARGEFQTVVWQLTNDLKRRYYTVVLDAELLKLARENQSTFAETVRESAELYKLGEISGLDLHRIEVEQLTFDTDVANSQRDYEVALRDLRAALGGDYRTMDIDVSGSLEYHPYDFAADDLRDKALAARPDLKAAALREKAADASIQLEDANKVPDLTVGAGIDQVADGTNTFTFGVGITLPIHNRNQTARTQALIEQRQAQNQERMLTNQVLADVDKALVAYNLQKQRVELYRTGVLAKADEVQNLTEFAQKAGESSTLELLDSIRTRRDTLAGYYQALFDYQMSLLDLELATATPLP